MEETKNKLTETKGKLSQFDEKGLLVDEAGNIFMLTNDIEGLVFMKQLTVNKGVK